MCMHNCTCIYMHVHVYMLGIVCIPLGLRISFKFLMHVNVIQSFKLALIVVIPPPLSLPQAVFPPSPSINALMQQFDKPHYSDSTPKSVTCVCV